jgi:hypothetical protein
MDSLTKDIFIPICSYLSYRDIDALLDTSMSIKLTVEPIDEDPLFWKSMVHNITGLDNLGDEPTINQRDYLKDIAITLDCNNMIDILMSKYKTGYYPYVYIAIALDIDIPDATVQKAFDQASYSNDIASVKLIYNSTSCNENVSLSEALGGVLERRKYNEEAQMIKFLLKRASEDEIYTRDYYTMTDKAPVQYVIEYGEVDMFRTLLSTKPITTNDDGHILNVLEWIFGQEDDITYKLLEVFIACHSHLSNLRIGINDINLFVRNSIQTDCAQNDDTCLVLCAIENTSERFGLQPIRNDIAYCVPDIDVGKFSGPIMELLVKCPMFTFDIVEVDKLSSEAAYLLYVSGKKCSHVISPCVNIISYTNQRFYLLHAILEPELLEQALLVDKPIHFSGLFIECMSTGNIGIMNILMKCYDLTKDQVTEILKIIVNEPRSYDSRTFELFCSVYNIRASDIISVFMSSLRSTISR